MSNINNDPLNVLNRHSNPATQVDLGFLKAINGKRKLRKLKPLSLNQDLSYTAADWLAKLMIYNDPARIVRAGYSEFNHYRTGGFTNIIANNTLNQTDRYQYGQDIAQTYLTDPVFKHPADWILGPDVDAIGFTYEPLFDKKNIFTMLTLTNTRFDELNQHQ